MPKPNDLPWVPHGGRPTTVAPGSPSGSSLTIQFGSVSFRFMVFQWKRWSALPQSLLTGLPHMLLLWPYTCSVHVTVHMLCCWDLLHSLLIGPSMFTAEGTFHILCWWGPSTCNVNGTFFMQCWWDLPNTLMMRWRDLFHAAASWFLIEQQWSKKR